MSPDNWKREKQMLNNDNKIDQYVLFSLDEFSGGVNSKMRETCAMVFFFLSYDNIVSAQLSIFKERRWRWNYFLFGGRVSLIDRYLVLFRKVLVRKQNRKSREMIVLYKVKPIIALTMPVSNYCTDYASVMLLVKMTEWRKQFRMTSYIWWNKLCHLCQTFPVSFFHFFCLFFCLWFIHFRASFSGFV